MRNGSEAYFPGYNEFYTCNPECKKVIRFLVEWNYHFILSVLNVWFNTESVQGPLLLGGKAVILGYKIEVFLVRNEEMSDRF